MNTAIAGHTKEKSWKVVIMNTAIARHTKEKSWKVVIMNIAIADNIYGIWQHINDICFDKNIDKANVVSKIIENIVYRGCMRPKLRDHIAKLMM
ncbi:unnamed protein product [Lathyrus sativus]|nr:unnamed protein product [Lathyrus sativus]